MALSLLGYFPFCYVIIATKPLVNLVHKCGIQQKATYAKGRCSRKGNVKHNEIVQIATNFNNMLDRLEKAFQIQKNFVHHASHELENPPCNNAIETNQHYVKI